MTSDQQKLTERQIEDEELTDWRVLFFTLHARFLTGDFKTGLKFVKKIGKAAEKADHHPDINLTYPQVDIRLMSHDVDGLTSATSTWPGRSARSRTTSRSSPRPRSSRSSRSRWTPRRTTTSRTSGRRPSATRRRRPTPRSSPTPTGTRPTLWFQKSDSADGEAPQRFHLDIRVPPEVAEDRVKAVLAAGGTLVSDEYAPTFWVLADKHGNKACITTWLGRDPDDEVSTRRRRGQDRDRPADGERRRGDDRRPLSPDPGTR